jgi:hypothetical protein
MESPRSSWDSYEQNFNDPFLQFHDDDDNDDNDDDDDDDGGDENK